MAVTPVEMLSHTVHDGDYEIEDTGAAIDTNTDDLWVNLREISKELRLYVDQKLDFISRIRDEIDDKFYLSCTAECIRDLH